MTAATALPIRHIWNVMGTVFTVDVRGGGVPAGVLDEVVAFSHRVDALFSPFKRDSQISLLNTGRLRRSECSSDVRAVLDRCDQLAEETGGYFDVRATGALDPSGYVKGWAIGELSRILVEGGSRHHCVNGGGDVQCQGDRGGGEPWRIGIAHPLQPMTYVDVAVGVGPLAVATSGTAERGAHIVNPRTGKRPIGLASVTVIGADIALVDVMATTCIAMGEGGAAWLRARGMQGVVVRSDGHVERLARPAA